MSVWFCTACGTPSGSLAERCLHCGAPRPGAHPGDEAPVTAPPMSGPPVTGPVPLAQYEVYAPPPEVYGPPPEAFPPQQHAPYAPPPAEFGQPPQHAAPFGPPPQQHAPQPGEFGPQQPGEFGPPQPEVFGQSAQPEAFAGYQQQPAYDPNQSNYQGYAPRQPGQRRRWWVPVLVVVVLLLAAGAIATVLLVDGGGDEPTAAPDPTPTGVSSPATRAPASTASSPTASASPSAPPRLVTTDPSVTDARAEDVAAMFEDYFTAINNRDYDRALSAYDPAGVINPNDTRQANDFKQGIGTTTDSQIVLRSVGPPASGRGVLDARVTFRSNQQPGYGPRERPNEPCTAWDITYALSQPAGEYRIVIGRATHAPC